MAETETKRRIDPSTERLRRARRIGAALLKACNQYAENLEKLMSECAGEAERAWLTEQAKVAAGTGGID